MKTFKTVWIALVMAVLLGAVIACSDAGTQKEQAAAPPAQQQNVASEAAQPTETAQAAEITGTVEDTDAGIVITADSGEYTVSGQDLSNMIGKTVKVTGAVEEAEGRYMIKVTSVSEAK
jgi:ribosome-binding protein aMBF1 (putative translation factor)